MTRGHDPRAFSPRYIAARRGYQVHLYDRHNNMGSPQIMGAARHAFSRAMVAQAQEMQLPAGGGSLTFHWGTSFEGLHVVGRIAIFSASAGIGSHGGSDSGGTISSRRDSGIAAAAEPEQCRHHHQQQQYQLRYDLLVAADGGWSRVRGQPRPRYLR